MPSTTLLRADEVRRVEFAGSRRGYDEKQVDDFLDRVATALEAYESGAARATSQPGAGAPQAAVDVLALAHRTAQEHVASAESAAAELLEQARTQAADVTAQAREESARIRADAQAQHDEVLEALRRERYRLEQRLPELRQLVERSRQDVQAYLHGILAAVQDAPAEQPSGPRALPAVSA